MLAGDIEAIRAEMETHYFGTLQVIRAFALSRFSYSGARSYAAAKAAEWNMTNGVRLALAEQGVLVQGLVLGAADTDISARYDGPKTGNYTPRDATHREIVRPGIGVCQDVEPGPNISGTTENYAGRAAVSSRTAAYCARTWGVDADR